MIDVLLALGLTTGFDIRPAEREREQENINIGTGISINNNFNIPLIAEFKLV